MFLKIPASLFFDTGPAFVSLANRVVHEQVDWLLRTDPHILLLYPSMLSALLDELTQRTARPKNLIEIRTVGETLSPFLRYRTRKHWALWLLINTLRTKSVPSRCSCGRGLPVINAILGRARNMLTTVTGRRWLTIDFHLLTEIAPIR